MTGRNSREQQVLYLRQQGLTWREIGERLEMPLKRAWNIAHPETVARHNRARNARKREWEREQAGNCADCGRPLATPRASRCEPCTREASRAAADERAERMIELRKQGLSNIQIGEREGVSRWAVATVLSRAKLAGIDVPPPPYWGRGEE